MLRRFLKYIEKTYKFSYLLALVKDSRIGAAINTQSISKAVFLMFALRLRSLNSLEQQWKDGKQISYWRRYLGSKPPSADTIGYSFSKFDCESLRKIQKQIYTKLQRNHILSKMRLKGLIVLSIDGHELNSSYKRCCNKCLIRVIHTSSGDRIQYYHRIVAAQLVRSKITIILDVELQLPGEDEVETATRLLKRLIRNYPKAFDVVTADAIYARSNFVNFLLAHKKHIVVVLKKNQGDLLLDFQGLVKISSPKEIIKNKIKCLVWDISEFNLNGIARPVRVIRSYETSKDKISDWYWITTLPQEKASADVIIEIGHARWEIENQGFNYAVNYYGLDHSFKHHPTAILAFILIFCISYLLFQAFYYLNLKLPLQTKYTLQQITQFLLRSLDNFLYNILLEPG